MAAKANKILVVLFSTMTFAIWCASSWIGIRHGLEDAVITHSSFSIRDAFSVIFTSGLLVAVIFALVVLLIYILLFSHFGPTLTDLKDWGRSRR